MRKTKRLALVATAAAGFIGSGVAFAAWTATGNGSGTAQADTAQALTTVAATTTGQLYPGGTGDVVITIHNPNPYGVDVLSVVGNGAITADAAHPDCTVTGVTFTDQTDLTGMHINANDDSTFTFTGAAAMSNASSDGCQGAVFTIPVTISGASA